MYKERFLPKSTPKIHIAVKKLYFYRTFCGGNVVYTRERKLDKLCLG
jgi:hypothetical protein